MALMTDIEPVFAGRITGSVTHERWPLMSHLNIARGSIAHTDLIVVTLQFGGAVGRGECSPSQHYGEAVEETVAAARTLVAELEAGAQWSRLHDATTPGAARNAVDCAVWDLRAKHAERPVWELIGLGQPRPQEEVMTIGLANPREMALAAGRAFAASFRILKLKFGGREDMACLKAVRAAVPNARLIVDVNEGWTEAQLPERLRLCRDLGVELIEQPLPAGADAILADIEHLVPIGADESCKTTADLMRSEPLYDLINIKLDKTGGLTEALDLARLARSCGLELMIGCRQGTSLALAPALLLGDGCRYVDLDSPLFLGRDREFPLTYEKGRVYPAPRRLWG